MYLPRSILPRLSLAFLLSACGDKAAESATSDGPESTSEAGSSTGGTTGGTTMTPPQTTGEPPSTTSSGTVTGDDSGNFLDPTGGASNQCDVWLQDCPEGEKCAAYADDGSEHWNSTLRTAQCISSGRAWRSMRGKQPPPKPTLKTSFPTS